MKFRRYLQLLGLALLMTLAACSMSEEVSSDTSTSSANSTSGMGMGMGMMGRGNGGGMMAFHQAPIPEEYAGLTNPVTADEESLARGEAIYTAQCAVCHGDGGMGDGPSAAALDPAPAAVAHTSQMMGDDYLFWRISEGGQMEPFNSTMIPWESVLSEEERWDVINYVQALGAGTVTPRPQMGGAAFDPEAEQLQREAMLATAIEQDVITQAEAESFTAVHTLIDELMAGMDRQSMSGTNDMLTMMLSTLVDEGKITQSEADSFADIHDRLGAAGLMQ